MSFVIRFIGRRLLRLAVTIAIVPLAGIAAMRVADRLERESGPSTLTRLLREAGGRTSYRRQ
ncbi:MAG: hypothetical protein M3Y91_00785 [Actinomycetota bacterium]|nr:hypothetical protein [Actinomycetota bacterium]